MPRERRDVPWLDTRDNGVYYAFWYDESRRKTERVSLRTRDPEKATAAFAAFLTDSRGDYKGSRRGGYARLTVEQALEDYYTEHSERDTVAPERIQYAARNLKMFMGQEHLANVDIPMSRAYAEERMSGRLNGRAVTSATVKRELNVLVAAANHARRWKRLSAEDMPSVELPKSERELTEGREVFFLTRQQISALRDAAAKQAQTALDALETAEMLDQPVKVLKRKHDACERLRSFIDLAYFTAARKTSIERLTWQQVDEVNGRLNLARSGDRRTNKRRPIVPIAAELRPTLARCRDNQINNLVLGSSAENYHALVKLCREALGLHAHPHILRHSRATHLLQDGVKPWAVASLLGDTLTTVLKTYGHHCPDYLEDALSVESRG